MVASQLAGARGVSTEQKILKARFESLVTEWAEEADFLVIVPDPIKDCSKIEGYSWENEPSLLTDFYKIGQPNK